METFEALPPQAEGSRDRRPSSPTGRAEDALEIHRADWMDEAACKGRLGLFFGIPAERPERRVRREAQARKVCSSCAVIGSCREWARLNGENGFWGGESEEERAAAGYAPRSISRRAVQRAAKAS
jgi:WhiB family redox-sensing transcriptional regulator